MVKSKVWKLKQHFNGKPKLSDFEMAEEELPDKLGKGEILCEVLHLTVDPYMRTREASVEPGSPMFGESISKVIISENPAYPVGTIIRSYSGWRSHIYLKDVTKPNERGMPPIGRMPDMGDLPLSLALGIMGMPGMTAYFGFLELCQPKKGDTVVVSGAAGAVGSIVGQIAKVKGCRVIGFAGTDDKCEWVKSLGFDEVFNYKKVGVDEALKKAAPEGVDCYFDNVGGDFTTAVFKNMKLFGRVSICGQISTYNATEVPTGPLPFMTILGKQLKVEGFIVMRWLARWQVGEKDMKQWIKEGKIKYQETITKGFENMPKAFIGLFEGSNTGKAIINT